MARKVVVSLLILGYASCMEMRETVQRMVMVRTTGSDLQPAATGYIYKKESDGPASVIKMGETEVMEHLSKLYEEPQAYLAPVPAPKGPFHEKDDESKAASHTSEVVKPVVEKSEDEDDGHIPGTVHEDYKKILEGYGSESGDYKDFSDYLHGIGHYGHGLFDHGEGSDYGLKRHHDYGDKGYKGYATNHKYGKGGAGDYHTEKYASYSVSNKGGNEKHHDEADSFGKDREQGHGYKGEDHGHKNAHSKSEEVDGYHKLFDKNEFKKDHDFFDGEKDEGKYHKYGNGHEYRGSNSGGFDEGRSQKSGHHEGRFGEGGFVDKESGDEAGTEYSGEDGHEASHYRHGLYGSKGGIHDGKSYGYEIKH